VLKDLDLPRILKKALRNGGDYSEIYFENTQTTQIIAEDGRIEKALGGLDKGIGLRVLHNGKTAYAYTTDLSQTGLEELANTVAEAVRGNSYDKTIVLRDISPQFVQTIQDPPAKHQIPDKIALVQRADKTAWQQDSKIQQVKVVYGDLEKKIQIANSFGEFVEDDRIYTLFFTQVVAVDGSIMQTGYHPEGGAVGLEILEDHPPEEIATTATKQALLMLKARKAPVGTLPVVISSEAGGTMIHEAVGHGLEADLACEGLSVYHKKIGQKIASEIVTVVDDATIPKKRGSFSFDDEGVPAQRSILIENGILKNYMFDRRYALQEGTNSTGNGRRESFRSRPICRMTNTMIAPGKDDPEETIRSTEKGLFVRKMGGGQVDTVNGDFVFEVSEGYLIEKGKLGEPVRGAVLTGNGPKVIQIVDRVCNDLGFSLGTCGKDDQGVPVGDAQPTIRIPELTVGGSA
jgi:TldD protein